MSAGPGHVLTLSVTKRDDPCISCSADLSDNLFTCPLAQGAQGQAGKVNFPQSSTSREDILPNLPQDSPVPAFGDYRKQGMAEVQTPDLGQKPKA